MSPAPSHRDNFDVDAGCGGQRDKIVEVRGQDKVIVLGEQHDCGIEHIAASRRAQQPASLFAQFYVQRHDLDVRKQFRQTGLPAGSTASDLSNHTTMWHRYPSELAFSLDACDEFPAATLDRDERPGVEHQRHTGRRIESPRTTMARARVARAA